MAPPISAMTVTRAVSEVKNDDVVNRFSLAKSERAKADSEAADTADLAVEDAEHSAVLAVCEAQLRNGDIAEDAEDREVLAASEADLTGGDTAKLTLEDPEDSVLLAAFEAELTDADMAYDS
jgi:hypothetical protein